MKSRINNKLMVSIVSALAPACALGVVAGIVVNAIKPTEPETLQTIVDKLNKVLKNVKCNTMSEVLTETKKTYDMESAKLEGDQEFVWDQKQNMVAIMVGNDVTVKSEGYDVNPNKWQTWKMVTEDTFDPYNQYSQYLKQSTSNSLTKTNYSSISGFDCGKNQDVKNVHYFYEKMDIQSAKDDIIINTCSENTSVDISAWDGEGSTGDTVKHYGTMGELTVVTNHIYEEYGNTISATIYDGTIDIDQAANIQMSYIRDEDVILKNYKTSGTIDEIYTDSSDSAIKTAIEAQHYTVASDHDVDDKKYQEIKEAELPTVVHVFTATNGTYTKNFESLTAIQEYSNDVSTMHLESEPDRFFTGWTITLNKDYDMAIEGYDKDGNFTWKPICATIDSGKKKYEYSKNAVQKGFAGTFDGNGHYILNMNFGTEANPITDETALFGGVNGTIKNLTIMDSNVNVKCTDWSSEEVIRQSGGGLLAMALGTKTEDAGVVTIENVHIVNSKLNCQYKSGLFAPYIQYCNELVVKDCSADEDTILNSTYDETTIKPGETGGGHGWFGHFAYYCKKTTLTNCTNYAAINGINCSAGFIGMYGSNAYGLTLENCKNHGKITTSAYPKVYGPQAGGLIGCIQQTSTSVITTIKIKDCVNEGAITAPCAPTDAGHQWRIGGFVGYVDDTAITGSTLEFENCTNKGQVGDEATITKAPTQAMGAGFVGSCLSSAGKLTLTFKSCTQAGYLCGVTVGHFAREKSTGSYTCENCSITGTIRQGAARITIDGEPA